MKRFVVFEGIDGSGKSTISREVYDRIKEKGIDSVLTYEPFSECIKRCIEDFLDRDFDPLSIAMLFIADRIEHAKLIKRWVDEGKIVICDRYEDSTYAYQGAQLEGRVKNPINFLKSITPEIIHPDIVFVLDINPDLALKRLHGERKLKDFERRDFLNKVRENYLKIAETGDRYRIIDAEMKVEKIVDICLKEIEKDEAEDRI